MGKFPRGTDERVKVFIASLVKNKNEDCFMSNGLPSVGKIKKLLKERLGIDVTRQTVHNYLKSEAYAPYMKDIDYSKNIDILDIKDKLKIAEDIMKGADTSSGDKTKALSVWRQLKQQYLDYEQHLKDIELKEIEAKKPIYLIQFNPSSAERVCPKCGHRFYDIHAKSMDAVEKTSNKFDFKSGNGQLTIDESVDDGKEKKDKNETA